MEGFFYSTTVFFKVLEFLSILLLVSAIFKRFKTIDKLTKGGVLVIIGAVFGILETIICLTTQSFVADKVLTILMFLFFAMGIGSFSKKIDRTPKQSSKTKKKRK